jgi:anti-sigma factor RsiW
MTTDTESLDCLTVVRELWDYLDGELDPARWTAIQGHLATCTGCAGHVAFARSFLQQSAQSLVDPAFLAATRARVTAALAERAS